MRTRLAMWAGAYLLAAASAYGSFIGSTVTFTGDYPILGTPITSTSAPCTVVPPCIFTVPGGVTPNPGIFLVPLTIVVDATTIDITYAGTLTLGAGAFNGYVLNFTGASPITGISINPSSTNPTAHITPTFTANSVMLNGAGALVISGATLNFDVTFGSPSSSVPEPGTLLTLGTGLGLLAVGASFKRKFVP